MLLELRVDLPIVQAELCLAYRLAMMPGRVVHGTIATWACEYAFPGMAGEMRWCALANCHAGLSPSLSPSLFHHPRLSLSLSLSLAQGLSCVHARTHAYAQITEGSVGACFAPREQRVTWWRATQRANKGRCTSA